MLKKILPALIAAAFGPRPLVSCRGSVADAAFKYRMGAGFPGDVNRTHPASIEPALNSAANPCTAYGQAVVIDAAAANAVRPLTTTDTGVTIVYGFTSRPFPIQQQTATNTGAVGFGSQTPPAGPIDVMRYGYIMAQMNTAAAAVKKGDAIFVWVAATIAGHVQGQLESAASGGNTAALDVNRYQFNGPADPSGIVELFVR